MRKGWIGFDLDGTLALYDGWRGLGHIGEPIPKMVEAVKAYLDEGTPVKIFTARVSDPAWELIGKPALEGWCKQYIGQVLEITNKKDYSMILLYDDRCVQIIENTGVRVDGKV